VENSDQSANIKRHHTEQQFTMSNFSIRPPGTRRMQKEKKRFNGKSERFLFCIHQSVLTDIFRLATPHRAHLPFDAEALF
jgi:hypothetical protein